MSKYIWKKLSGLNKRVSILKFVEKEEIAKIRVYIKSGTAWISETNGLEETPLHKAVRVENTDIVQLLLKEKADPNLADKKGDMPLHIACQKGNKEIALILLQNGAKMHKKNNVGNTPLHIVCQKGKLEMLNMLWDAKADTDFEIANNKKQTALHLACIASHYPVVERLIDLGAKIDTKDAHKKRPLHYACNNGHTQIVVQLLASGANKDAQDIEKNTPMHYACNKGFLDITILLLEKYANPYLKNKKHAEMNIKILEAEAEETGEDIERLKEKLNIGKTPIEIACENNYDHLIKGFVDDEFPNTYSKTVGHFVNIFEQIHYSQFLGKKDTAVFHDKLKKTTNQKNLKYIFEKYLPEPIYENMIRIFRNPETLLIEQSDDNDFYIHSEEEQRSFRCKRPWEAYVQCKLPTI